MKKFDLKNTGILLAIMLVAGAVLVGPVSAFKEEVDYSASDYFKVAAVGDYHANSWTECVGESWTVSGNPAGKIYVKAQIFDDNHDLKYTIRDTQYNVDDVEVSGVHYHSCTYSDPYAKTTMNSDSPDDLGFVYAYHI